MLSIFSDPWFECWIPRRTIWWFVSFWVCFQFNSRGVLMEFQLHIYVQRFLGNTRIYSRFKYLSGHYKKFPIFANSFALKSGLCGTLFCTRAMKKRSTAITYRKQSNTTVFKIQLNIYSMISNVNAILRDLDFSTEQIGTSHFKNFLHS